MPNAFLIAAPRSGSGKTTVTLAILAALRARGIAVRAAKAGPDYIDPAFHAAATGWPSANLDSWAMPPRLLEAVAAGAAGDGSLLVVEAAMGLFDGAGDVPGRSGSAADLAARFGWPVVLVMDVSGQSQSAAAVACGFAGFDPLVRLAGVVLNRVASERHRTMAASACAAAGLRVLGALPRAAAVALPERHLGLVQAAETEDLAARLAALGRLAEAHLDLDALAGLGVAVPAAAAVLPLPPPGQRVAVASDAAFGFVYPHVLAGWRRAGAEVMPFSPLADEAPDGTADAVWLPGGYPELQAGRIAAAARFGEGMRRFGGPVHGECGGYMVLGEGLVDAAGERHAMLGLLGHSTSYAARRMHLGYREARLLGACALGRAGTVLRGHEFHYATMVEDGAAGGDLGLAALTDANGAALGEAGGRRGRVSGSFFHAIAVQE